MSEVSMNRKTAFKEKGFKESILELEQEVERIYLEDNIPWVVGYSGGKDSTAVLQIIWNTLAKIPKEKLHKKIHVISTDTLVENPIVSQWIIKSHNAMKETIEKQGLPIEPHLLMPTIEDSFWTNLIGKGYPAPRHKFRWCTTRLKINPSNAFIKSMVHKNGEAIIVLGTRSSESAARAKVIERHKQNRTRDKLSPNPALPNCFIYAPLETWSDDDVWLYLMQQQNPWGHNNKALLTMYQGATTDGECPLVVDTNTKSCGDSRFGCWICTLVGEDKSMSAMIQNDEEKEWMLPLLEFRNELDFRGEEKHNLENTRRDFRRMNGRVNILESGNVIHGPYTQEAREEWLRKLLKSQMWIRKNGPEEVKYIDLVTIDELREIRRIWVVEKHEFEDTLPKIYEDIIGCSFPDDCHYNMGIGSEALGLLKDLCKDDDLQFQMIRELLNVEVKYRTMNRRSNLYKNLEDAFKRSFYSDEEEASEIARNRKEKKDFIRNRNEDIFDEYKVSEQGAKYDY